MSFTFLYNRILKYLIRIRVIDKVILIKIEESFKKLIFEEIRNGKLKKEHYTNGKYYSDKFSMDNSGFLSF
jgi:hypothetical protein